MKLLQLNDSYPIQEGDLIPIPPYLPSLTLAVNKCYSINPSLPLKPLVLDVGCGDRSDLSQYLRNSGYDAIIHGIDIDDYARNNPDVDQVFIGSAEEMPFTDSTYDVVFSQFLLEHVEDANKTLFSMTRVLKEQGALLITIPNPVSPEGLVTKLTPYSFHIRFKKVVQKVDNASNNTFPTRFAFKSVKNIHKILQSLGYHSVYSFYVPESYYRFRKRYFLGKLSISYTKVLDILGLSRLQSTVVIVAIK
jgi:ubiquinone/menaquinone biosynthesis C-methylase UbiE